jgi:hypothetical protein
MILTGCQVESTAQLHFVAPKEAPPAYGTLPFPSDVYLDEKGHIGEIPELFKVAPWNTDLVAAHASALDGFSVRPVMEVFVEGHVDPESIKGALFVIDVDPRSPVRGEKIPSRWRWDPERSRMVGTPLVGEVLREANLCGFLGA